ncbi:DJ-1/PfpI family protein [Streptomyces sp. NPDC059080]|uniref:DJ-1/PfpI family protein n=1 Tax=Streptomyces sp. NPDC059080 TaxID=3346718 RepID=UPI0036899184
MQIAIVLFEGFTALDAVGPYEMLCRAPGAETVFVAERPGPVPNDMGSLTFVADKALDEVPAPGIVVVPGGPGQTDQMANETLLGWLRTASATSTWTTSVCTGSLLLGAAGLLKGRRATSHWHPVPWQRPGGALVGGERAQGVPRSPQGRRVCCPRCPIASAIVVARTRESGSGWLRSFSRRRERIPAASSLRTPGGVVPTHAQRRRRPRRAAPTRAHRNNLT